MLVTSKRNVKSVIARRKIVCTHPFDCVEFSCVLSEHFATIIIICGESFASAQSVVSFFGKYRILVRSLPYRERIGVNNSCKAILSFSSLSFFFVFNRGWESRTRTRHMHNTNAEKKRAFLPFFFSKPQSFRFYLLENFASNTIEFRRMIQSPNGTNSYHVNYKNFFATNASPDARNGYATNTTCRLSFKYRALANEKFTS